ncbi:MAG: helix-turn-helix domain-containing protein [Aristaeellaceae bacterium]
MIDYKDFGARVRSLRRQKGLTQEELAERVDISASFMGHIERGTRIASLETLVALCNELKVSPQELLSASLVSEIDEHMPAHLSNEDRNRLSAFLRMANEAVSNWGE